MGHHEGGNEQNETILSADKDVSRRGDIVFRPSGDWTTNVHALIRHLHKEGISFAPALIGSGLSPEGREMMSYVEGEFVHPGPWSDEALIEVGQMLRRLHGSTANFEPPRHAVWKPWFMRQLGGSKHVYSHCDVAPWNTVTRNGMPIALIDWEFAGPVDPLFELARVCWLFPQLHDDDVAELVGLPPLKVRARQVRLLVDAYGLSLAQREGFIDRILEVVVRETAEEAIEARITPDSQGALWGLAWRARAAAWILRNRTVLQRQISG